MGLHAIYGWVAVDSGMTQADLQTAMEDWVFGRDKWGDQPSLTVRRVRVDPIEGGTEVLRFEMRFELTEAKDNLLQKCADKIKNKVDYFRLVYHQCDHDEEGRAGCSWSEKWEWEDSGVTVPTDVEATIPDAPTVVGA